MRLRPLLFVFSHLFLALIWCLPCLSAPLGSLYEGYVSDVQKERETRYTEIFLFQSRLTQEVSLHEQIFSPLSNEFKNKYREQFGQLDTEQIQYRNAFNQIDENRGANPLLQSQNEKRKAFAEYMTKRLIEHHVDSYMRSKPEMRPVIEVKEKIQNIKVEVNKETRLNIQYNFAANIIDLILDNPYCESKMALEMNPRAFGPGEVLESRIWLSKNLSKTLRVNSNVATTDGIFYADLTKSYPLKNFSHLVGVRTAYTSSGTSLRETTPLIGFSHTY